jgi:hypothetical protein
MLSIPSQRFEAFVGIMFIASGVIVYGVFHWLLGRK